jgi:hypothetical protein
MSYQDKYLKYKKKYLLIKKKISNKMWGGAPIGTFPAAAAASTHTENLTPRLIREEYRKNLFEMNEYDEILFHIFSW